MALPLLFLAGAAGVGLVKAGKAFFDNDEAQAKLKRARRVQNEGREIIESARQSAKEAIDTLGTRKVAALQNDILPFVESFKRLKNVEFTNSDGLNELNNFAITEGDFATIAKMESLVGEMATGLVGGAVGRRDYGFWRI